MVPSNCTDLRVYTLPSFILKVIIRSIKNKIFSKLNAQNSLNPTRMTNNLIRNLSTQNTTYVKGEEGDGEAAGE